MHAPHLSTIEESLHKPDAYGEDLTGTDWFLRRVLAPTVMVCVLIAVSELPYDPVARWTLPVMLWAFPAMMIAIIMLQVARKVHRNIWYATAHIAVVYNITAFSASLLVGGINLFHDPLDAKGVFDVFMSPATVTLSCLLYASLKLLLALVMPAQPYVPRVVYTTPQYRR